MNKLNNKIKKQTGKSKTSDINLKRSWGTSNDLCFACQLGNSFPTPDDFSLKAERIESGANCSISNCRSIDFAWNKGDRELKKKHCYICSPCKHVTSTKGRKSWLKLVDIHRSSLKSRALKTGKSSNNSNYNTKHYSDIVYIRRYILDATRRIKFRYHRERTRRNISRLNLCRISPSKANGVFCQFLFRHAIRHIRNLFDYTIISFLKCALIVEGDCNITNNDLVDYTPFRISSSMEWFASRKPLSLYLFNSNTQISGTEKLVSKANRDKSLAD
jgi:hypothetical protein